MPNDWTYCGLGLPDTVFIRGRVPMTKREVRVLTLAQLRLQPGQVVWDVGAGTGSLAIEAALAVPSSQVYAIERNAEGVELLQQNSSRFGTDNLTVVAAEAPAALVSLPQPQRVIVGGSGGQLTEILTYCGEKLTPDGILVVNVVTPQNMVRTLERLSAEPFTNRDGLYVQASRLQKLGREDYFQAQNGVWIISAQKEETK
ncbi:MAG TPA: precorrin-6Y C5,15-methyltransferase (decarboxylating) subunit CbiT [Oscillospiraceae bacterium]|nr:precorrin-6Y C5,15-methyltransferase (decarboxylating) subunit CbiT [Oscillospiraceae bacterium]